MKNLLIILLSLASLNVFATHYYVSNSGNDTNTGLSTASPFLTIAKVNSLVLVPGDIVSFNGGDSWHEALIISYSGSTGNPIIYNSYGTGKAIITGFTTVGSWTSLGSSIYESSSAVSTLKDCNMVVINGVNTAMGRIPNTGYLPYQSATVTSITSSSLSGTPNWTGADVVMKIYNFTVARNPITSQSGGTLNFVASTTDAGSAGYGFFIENDVRTLDAQNEWYYKPYTAGDATSGKLKIYSAATPVNVQATTLDTLVYMTGKNYLTFDNLDFRGSNRRAFYIGSSSSISILNCNFDFHANHAVWGGNNWGSPSNSFVFLQNTLNHINSQAIVLASEYYQPYIGYSTFKNCGALAGMFKIDDRIDLWNGAYQPIMISNVNGAVIEYCKIDSTGYNGISLQECFNARIDHNEVSNHCLHLQDGAGIYEYSHDDPQTRIFSNIVRDGWGDNTGTPSTDILAHGIYLDEGFPTVYGTGNTRNVEVHHNHVFNNRGYGIFSNSNTNCNFHDNTSYNNSNSQFCIANNNPYNSLVTGIQVNNNIFFSKTDLQPTAKYDTRDGSVIPFFTSSNNNYYAKPIAENQGFPNASIDLAFNGYTTFSHYTLAQWKTYSGLDAASNYSPKTVPLVDSLRIEYNATQSAVTRSLPYNYEDVAGVQYPGTITLQPYTSKVLIQNGSANASPVANAGSDQTITLPVSAATMAGSGTDSDGTIASYAWTKISGPGATTITTPSIQNPVMSNLQQGTYIFRLTVTDNLGATGFDEVQVYVSANPASSNLFIIHGNTIFR